MKQIHHLQLEILRKLVFSPKLKYLQLKPSGDIENNQFDFHLNRLMEMAYVEKNDNKYQLSTKGKEYTTRMDTDSVEIMKQAKLSVWLAVTRKVKGKLQFLIYTRLKHPFYGCQGFGGGKMAFGERIVDTAQRELKEETGLEGKAEIIKMAHYRVFDRNKNLLEDKIMFLCRIASPIGSLTREVEEGKYEWVDENKIEDYITKPFEDMSVIMSYIKEVKEFSGRVTIEEQDVITNKF